MSEPTPRLFEKPEGVRIGLWPLEQGHVHRPNFWQMQQRWRHYTPFPLRSKLEVHDARKSRPKCRKRPKPAKAPLRWLRFWR